MYMAPCSSLFLLMSGKEIKALHRSVMVGVLVGVREQPVPCRFCGAPDGDCHLFGTIPSFLLLRSVKS